MGYTISHENSYFQGNLNISEHTVTIDGAQRDLAEYQCYAMCGVDSCTGPHCNCEGFLSGFDGPDSNALCASEDLCMYLCDQIDDCGSIDMNHMNGARCFLNHKDADQLGGDTSYTVLTKSRDPNAEHLQGDRRMEGDDSDCKDDPAYTDSQGYTCVDWGPALGFPCDEAVADGYFVGSDASQQEADLLSKCKKSCEKCDAKETVAGLLETMDLGYSWDKMLRFTGIKLSTGGTFKVCFCDSTLSTNKADPCNSESDFDIEVGTVHSSGVSCLLNKPRLQRVSCTNQFHGGLRCYNYMNAPEREMPLVGPLTEVDRDGMQEDPTPSGSLKCMYGAEEEGCETEDEAGHQTPP